MGLPGWRGVISIELGISSINMQPTYHIGGNTHIGLFGRPYCRWVIGLSLTPEKTGMARLRHHNLLNAHILIEIQELADTLGKTRRYFAHAANACQGAPNDE